MPASTLLAAVLAYAGFKYLSDCPKTSKHKVSVVQLLSSFFSLLIVFTELNEHKQASHLVIIAIITAKSLGNLSK